jgi:trimethylamine:corrinoid methyltransferase-like protein
MIGTIPVDEAHLQAELIERVGIGGHYLTQRETRDYTVSEYVPVWPPAGETMLEIVHEEALDILHNHLPPPLTAGAADEIEEILAEADRELSRK